MKQALAEYINAMQRTGDFAASRHNLGNLYADLGQTDRAIDHYRKAIAIDRLFYPAKVNLAMLYIRRGKKIPAEALLREVVEEHPDLYEIKYSLGLLLAEKKPSTMPSYTWAMLPPACPSAPESSTIWRCCSSSSNAIQKPKPPSTRHCPWTRKTRITYTPWRSCILNGTGWTMPSMVALQLRDSHPTLAMGRDLVNYITQFQNQNEVGESCESMVPNRDRYPSTFFEKGESISLGAIQRFKKSSYPEQKESRMKILKWIAIALLGLLAAGSFNPLLAVSEQREAYNKMVEEATQEADEYLQEKENAKESG
jgi:tetratricopeptide (TPR) repeat protein